jgi:SAM-dependent methyltransferase
MADQDATASGSASTQADLWGERAHDWADVMEGWSAWGIPVYRHVLERVTLAEGATVLDVGCGAGRFCRIAADRGARVAGLDATPAFVEIARERVPDGDFRVGEMEELPWPDDSFDLVTGFNSFFIAADMVNALREAGRVARPFAPVATSVFGRPERCDSTTIFGALGGLLPSKPTGDSDPDDEAGESHPLHEEGALEALATNAGLTPGEAGYLKFAEEYPNLETLLRGMLAAPPWRRAARAVGEEAVREAVTARLGPFADSTGRYRLEEEIRYLIATA